MTAREYVVEVKTPGRVSVRKVLAVSPAHAKAQALEQVGVEARVLGKGPALKLPA